MAASLEIKTCHLMLQLQPNAIFHYKLHLTMPPSCKGNDVLKQITRNYSGAFRYPNQYGLNNELFKHIHTTFTTISVIVSVNTFICNSYARHLMLHRYKKNCVPFPSKVCRNWRLLRSQPISTLLPQFEQ